MGRPLDTAAHQGFVSVPNPGKRAGSKCLMCGISYTRSDPKWKIKHKYVQFILTFLFIV